ncbi:MAG: Ribosome-binding ATPase YchF [Acidobacteria bacterium ADurb.Bin051]|nr:MAG: Ribosome-binding ATPase YchF [Acidobacteria bacterium ADurb.Bin051]
MQFGILGLPKAGKTTLFNTLTAAAEETGKFSASDRTHVGVARVPDPRLARLRDLYRPRRYVPATVEYVDIPGLQRGEGAESLDLGRLRTVDGLLHVVRAFTDPEIPHPDGAVDPRRDIETIDLELILADHSLVERRLERLGKAAKRGLSPQEVREEQLLREVVLPALEEERPLRALGLAGDDEKLVRGFQLLSAKPLLVVVNVDEAEVATARPEEFGLGPEAEGRGLVVSAPIELEISRLAPAEQQEFLADLGLAEPSLDRLIRACYRLLGVHSFFTVGDDEVRAWTIRRGTVAREAAGVIHSDLERGFIRAEVVAWDDLLRLGSLAACRDKGLLRLEGKEYVVADGEVVHVRFNV